MNSHEKVVELLNDLIYINRDRISDYQKGIESLKSNNGNLITTYSRLIEQCLNFNDELKKYIFLHRGRLKDIQAEKSYIYSYWLNERNTQNYFTDVTIEICENYRKAALKAYSKVLEVNDIHLDTREIIVKQIAMLNASCQHIKDSIETKKIAYA